MSVSLSVCLLPRFLLLRATIQQNSDTNGFITTLASFKKFRITTEFGSYGVKCKQTSHYANKHRLTSTGSACSVFVGDKRSLNKGRVSTPACYLLPVASQCQSY